jgi:hypothetical protein
MTRKQLGPAPSTPQSTVRKVDLDSVASPWDYGLWPRVVWTGSSWPTRASSIPVGYTGNVEYFSPFDSGATSPTDRITNDIWTRVIQ